MYEDKIQAVVSVVFSLTEDALTKGSRAIEMYKNGKSDQEICDSLRMKPRELQMKKLKYLKK